MGSCCSSASPLNSERHPQETASPSTVTGRRYVTDHWSITEFLSLSAHASSYSLEGLSGGQEELRGATTKGPEILEPARTVQHDREAREDRGSLVSLTEEQEQMGEHGRLDNQVR